MVGVGVVWWLWQVYGGCGLVGVWWVLSGRCSRCMCTGECGLASVCALVGVACRCMVGVVWQVYGGCGLVGVGWMWTGRCGRCMVCVDW